MGGRPCTVVAVAVPILGDAEGAAGKYKSTTSQSGGAPPSSSPPSSRYPPGTSAMDHLREWEGLGGLPIGGKPHTLPPKLAGEGTQWARVDGGCRPSEPTGGLMR